MTYNQPFAVKVSCGFGGSMDEVPMMLLPTIPTMVWGGNVRLIGRGLGIEIDAITEEVERLPLEQAVDTVMGPLRGRHAGRLLAQGDRVVGRTGAHRHRPHHPHPPVVRAGLAAARSRASGDHRVIVDGDPAADHSSAAPTCRAAPTAGRRG